MTKQEVPIILVFLALLVRQAAVAGDIPRQPQGLPEGLNSLMVGCNQPGAIVYLLETGGGRLEKIPHSAHPILDVPPSGEKYDSAVVLRLGSQAQDTWAPGKVYLYFQDGYLAYKCHVLDEEDVKPEVIFQREIESGLQHPPNYPGLMDKVHWGKARRPLSSDPEEREKLPKVRCGLALEGLPPFAKQRGYNALVLFQNVGSVPLEDNIVLMGFPVNPGVSVQVRSRSRGISTGPIEVFGVYGAKKLRAITDDDSTAFTAPFRLRPGEATFVWFQVDNSLLAEFDTIHAEIRFIWGLDENRSMRTWDACSPAMAIPKEAGEDRKKAEKVSGTD